MLERISILGPVKRPKRPRDPNELAKMVADLATSRISEPSPEYNKNPAAVELGRLGGLKGGKARARALSKTKRSQIAKKAARARWKKR